MSNIDKRTLREELSNPAIGSKDHLRKLALALLDELEAAEYTAAVDHEAACSLVGENEELKRRIVELNARAFNPAILDVIAERQRQKTVEGCTPEHDDQYDKSQLLWASSCYVLNTIQPFKRIPMDLAVGTRMVEADKSAS